MTGCRKRSPGTFRGRAPAPTDSSTPSLEPQPMSLASSDATPEPVSSAAVPHLQVRARRGWQGVGWRELWQHRELLGFLAWRDIRVRYKQTLLGAGWAILQPLLSMVVFSLFFGELVGVPSDGIPYPIFAYSALLPWQLFESGVSKAGGSLVLGRNLVTKVYFPRLAVPIAPVLAGLPGFAL